MGATCYRASALRWTLSSLRCPYSSHPGRARRTAPKLDPFGQRAPRVYSDAEIAEFLTEDRISPETAERVRELMRAWLV